MQGKGIEAGDLVIYCMNVRHKDVIEMGHKKAFV
jgi:hypothetical protein